MRGLLTRRSNGGGALLETLVAIALCTVIAFVAGEYLQNRRAVWSKLRNRGELLDARRYVRAAIDCTHTLHDQWASCDGKTDIALRGLDGAGSPWILPQRLGRDLDLRARCRLDQGAYLFDVDYRRQTRGSRVDWQPLFSAAPPICGGYKILDLKSDPYESMPYTYPPHPVRGIFRNWIHKSLWSQYLAASDLENVDLLTHGGGVRHDGAPLHPDEFRRTTEPELSMIFERFATQRMSIMVTADNGLTVSAGAQIIDRAAQGAFSWWDRPPAVWWTAVGANAAVAPFLRGVTYYTANDGLSTPGYVRNPTAPAICTFWAPACAAAYLPRLSPTSGVAYFHGNAAVAVVTIAGNFMADKFMREVDP